MQPAEWGDWQWGGAAIPPHAVFGTWKGAVRTIDRTKSPAVVTVTPDADLRRTIGNLGAGRCPSGRHQGMTAMAPRRAGTSSDLKLLPGHSYRFVFHGA